MEANMQQQIERLRQIKEQRTKLSDEYNEIIQNLPESFVYKSDKLEDSDKPFIRFTKIDNLSELTEKGSIFRAIETQRFTTKIETLKNEPKEK